MSEELEFERSMAAIHGVSFLKLTQRDYAVVLNGLLLRRQSPLPGIWDRSGLPQESGVYALFDQEEIIYIGKSANVARRVYQHGRKNGLTFTHVSFVLADRWITDFLERSLIRGLKPKYNRAMAN